MAKKTSLRTFIFPALYVLFIAAMFFWHAQDTDLFGHVNNKLSLRGILQISSRGTPTVSQLDIQYEGLSFPFFTRTSVSVTDSQKNTRRLDVTGYNTLENGFVLHFTEGFQIRFHIDEEESKSLRITPIIPDNMQPISEISLPLKLTEDANIRQSDNIGELQIQVGQQQYVLTLPSRAVLNAERGILTLPGSAERQTIHYTLSDAPPVRVSSSRTRNQDDEPEAEPQEDVADQQPWYETEEIRLSQASFLNSVNTYIGTAYQGWRSGRFNAEQGGWLQPDGSYAFSEASITAALAEAWTRNEYNSIFESMRAAADLHPQQLSYLSSPFLGNLRAQRANMQSADQARSTELIRSFSRRATTPLEDPELIHWIITRGSSTVFQQLPAYLQSIQPNALEPAQLIGLLENSLDDTPMPAEIRAALDAFQRPAAQLLLTKLQKIDSSIYLNPNAGSENATADMLLSIRAGQGLREYGLKNGNAQLAGIGRTMVRSVLSLQDANGFLPQSLRLNGNSIAAREGTLLPETVYPFIQQNPAWPRVYSLFDQLGQGSYVFSTAPIISAEKSENELRLSFTNVRNRTHYLYIGGLPKYQILHLFGYQWPADPNFENYSRGTYYDQASNTALIKFFESSTTGQIRYEFAVAAPATPAAPAQGSAAGTEANPAENVQPETQAGQDDQS